MGRHCQPNIAICRYERPKYQYPYDRSTLCTTCQIFSNFSMTSSILATLVIFFTFISQNNQLSHSCHLLHIHAQFRFLQALLLLFTHMTLQSRKNQLSSNRGNGGVTSFRGGVRAKRHLPLTFRLNSRSLIGVGVP